MSRTNKKQVIMVFMIVLFFSNLIHAMTAEDIIRAMDQNENYATSYMTGSIATTDRFGEKITTFKAWSQGAYDSLIEFTSLAERGQKILRNKGELYLYYPDTEELIRLQGAALRQSVLGSDLSYEDMTGEKNTLDMYTVSFDNEDIVHNQACYVLTLTAKSRTVAYPVQKIWVDKETYIVHKGQYSSATGRLLKEFEVLETKVIDNRTIPVKTKISDILKKDSYTVMAIEELQIDIPLDANIFTLQSLMW